MAVLGRFEDVVLLMWRRGLLVPSRHCAFVRGRRASLAAGMKGLDMAGYV